MYEPVMRRREDYIERKEDKGARGRGDESKVKSRQRWMKRVKKYLREKKLEVDDTRSTVSYRRSLIYDDF